MSRFLHRIGIAGMSVAAAITLTSCLPLPVEGDLIAVSVPTDLKIRVSPSDSIVVLADGLEADEDNDAEYAAWCLRRFIRERAPDTPMIEAKRFRETITPLLKKSGGSYAALSEAIANPETQRELDRLNLRYAIVAREIIVTRYSRTVHSSGRADADAEIWNLQTGEFLGVARSTASGETLTVLNPVLIPEIDNETPACRGLGHELGSLLKAPR